MNGRYGTSRTIYEDDIIDEDTRLLVQERQKSLEQNHELLDLSQDSRNKTNDDDLLLYPTDDNYKTESERQMKIREQENVAYRRFFILPSTFCIAMGLAIPYSGSVFIYPVRASCPDWPAQATTIAISLAVGACAISGFVAGLTVERTGPRVLGLVGSGCGVLGLLLASFIVESCLVPWIYYLSMGVLLGINSGIGYMVGLSTVLSWYPKAAGFAGSYFGGALGVGCLLISEGGARLLQHHSSHSVLMMCAGFVAACNLGFWPFIRWKPINPKPGSSARTPLGTLLRTPKLWVFLLSYWASLTPGWGILTMCTVMLFDSTNLDSKDTSKVLSIYMVIYAVSRAVFGTISDKLGRQPMYVFVCLGQAVLLGTLPLYYESKRHTHLFVVIIALVLILFGGSKVLAPGYIVDNFGVSNRARIVGMSVVCFGCAGLLGGVWISQLYEDAVRHTGFERFRNFCYCMGALTLSASFGFLMVPKMTFEK
eukprot:m.286303 g.286303  ORF g.286303 m.286303 type:complete len:482 (+) comp16350_c0_seq2:287-1732(+)